MKSFQIRVTDKCKGELTLKATKKALRRNWVSTLTEEELADPDTQFHLRAGRIEILDDEKPVIAGKYFRSTTHRILTLGGLDRIINQNETFFVNEIDLDDAQLNDYIERGWFEEVSDEEIKEKSKKSKKTSKKTTAKKTSKKTTKKTAKKDESAVAKTKVVAQKKEDEIEEADAEAQADATPEGMYVHTPDEADAPAPRRVPKTETILDLDLDGPDEGEGLSFVDDEQREARKLPVASDNSEVE